MYKIGIYVAITGNKIIRKESPVSYITIPKQLSNMKFKYFFELVLGITIAY